MKEKKTDKIYFSPLDQIAPFEFDENVVNVFDDMINRSVPFYGEIVRRQAQLAAHFYMNDTVIFDLGCSHGNFGIALASEMGERDFRIKAIDNSEPMVTKYRDRLSKSGLSEKISVECSDIRDTDLKNTSAVVMNLTLQFLPVADRSDFIKRIHEALIPGGIFLITEKIHHKDEFLDDLEQVFYYRFKKENGYSELEISQKREALENVLVPDTLEQHMARFEAAGFRNIAIWHKWFNFCSFICVK